MLRAKLILALCSLGMGTLIFLEKGGWRSRRRMIQLWVALLLLARPLRVTMLGHPDVMDEMVLQTTDYTCSPAAIATLMRYTGRDPNFSEADALRLTNTSRWGTSTISQNKALRKLEFQPLFKTGLTVEDLAQRQQFAILIVDEPIGNQTISHAVLLISVSPDEQEVTIANPLYGKETKTYQEMKGYWTGAATYVEERLRQASSLNPEITGR